ncbi:MAG: HPF/RaiA family ribosome-associated protein, partial [Microgenomates group bacterium]
FRSKLQTGFVKLSKGERWGYKVKTMLRLPGKEIVAEGQSETLLSAIDDVYAKASRGIKQYLERMKDKKHR